ncbi:MAG: hypothetical protein MUC94_16165 [bacterium]|jgi:hypothetical protein|nr:hypothetical protein [bacterium]
MKSKSIQIRLSIETLELLNKWYPRLELRWKIEQAISDLQKLRLPVCENCGHSMTIDSFENVNDRTAGFVITASEFDEFGHICFGCARKLNLIQWIRDGATQDELYSFLSSGGPS